MRRILRKIAGGHFEGLEEIFTLTKNSRKINCKQKKFSNILIE